MVKSSRIPLWYTLRIAKGNQEDCSVETMNLLLCIFLHKMKREREFSSTLVFFSTVGLVRHAVRRETVWTYDVCIENPFNKKMSHVKELTTKSVKVQDRSRNEWKKKIKIQLWWVSAIISFGHGRTWQRSEREKDSSMRRYNDNQPACSTPAGESDLSLSPEIQITT